MKTSQACFSKTYEFESFKSFALIPIALEWRFIKSIFSSKAVLVSDNMNASISPRISEMGFPSELSFSVDQLWCPTRAHASFKFFLQLRHGKNLSALGILCQQKPGKSEQVPSQDTYRGFFRLPPPF